MKPFKSYLLAGIVSCVMASCSNHTPKIMDTPTSGSLKVLADETFKPILDEEITVFQALYPYAKVQAVYQTETDALNGLFRDSSYLAIATRPLSKDEVDFFEAKKLFPKSLNIAFDAVALIVNPQNSDTLITVDEFRKVLAGTITHWNQLGAAKATDDITVVFDNKNSSTVRFMLDSVCNHQPISNAHMALNTNAEVIAYVHTHRNAIGVIGVSWISDRDDPRMLSFLDKIKVMAVSKETVANANNSYQPYQAYLWNHNYPFVRNVYVINADPHNGLATGFAAFLASERGQRIILKTGILPATQPFRIIQTKDHL